MGLWSWVCSKLRAAKDWVVDKAKKVGSAIKNGVTNAWNKFTGKDDFLKAEKLYEKITDKYNSRRSRYLQDVETLTKKIEDHILIINESKKKIKMELFTDMAFKMKKIVDIAVSDEFAVENYVSKDITFDDISSRSKLFKIDFNKNKFKTTFQAVFTFGFYTRKKSKETLYEVQQEEAKLKNEMAKMNAETKKIEAIEKALSNIEFYFVSLIEIYENLLVRLDVSVNYLYVRCLNLAHKIIHTEMSIRKLPKVQQKEIEAMITISKILKEMTDMQITSVENEEFVKKCDVDLKNSHEKINSVYEAA